MAELDVAAALALSAASSVTKTVTGQVQRTADAAQCLVAQAKTGQNPIFKINPPQENDPSGYLEDDESIARGAAKWIVRLLGLINDTLADVRDKGAQTVVDSQVDPLFLTPGSSAWSKRYARLMTDLGKIGTAMNLQKDQGHRLNKSAEMLMNFAKGFYNQAGSVIYNEAPLVINAARMLVNRGSTILDEADDLFSRTQSQIHRTNLYVLVAKKLVEVTGTEGRTMVSKGDFKAITASGKSILLQSGKDLTLRAADNIAAQAGKDVSVSTGASNSMTMTAGSGGATVQSTGNTNIKGAMVLLGSGGTSPTAPTSDTVTSTTVDDVAVGHADKKPGLLTETALGRTPAGVNPPRTSPDEVVNRE